MSPLTSLRNLLKNLPYLMPINTKIGYAGWLGHGNLGDEAMFMSFKNNFNRFLVLPFKNSKKTELLEHVVKRAIFQAVFLGGGTLINGASFSQMEYAQQKKIPTFIFGSGVKNPAFWDKLGKVNLLSSWDRILEKCRFIGVRGPLSQRILEERDVKKIEIIGDPALFLGKNAMKNKHLKRIIGINVGVTNNEMWGNEEEFLNFIVDLTKILINKGWRVTFLPVKNSDLSYIKEAIRRIGTSIPIFYHFRSPIKTINFLETCDLFIGEKLHSVILAMCSYTPSIMLEYRPKCLDFMMSMDLEEFNLRTDKLSLDLTLELIDKLYNNSQYYQNFIFQKVDYYKRIQKEKADFLTKQILSN